MMKWEEVWRSLDWDRDSYHNVEETLDQRADKYARPPEQDSQNDQDTLKALVFERGQERYAIPAQHVLRGVAEPRITPLPCVPDYYRGVINVRGRIISVLDLRRFWRIPVRGEVETPRLIVVRAGAHELAIQADDVLELARIPLSEIVPPVTAGIGLEHVQGISSDGLVVVDVESLSRDQRLFIHDEL